MKWRILTEGEERVKRQEVAVGSVKGHVDNATIVASRMTDNHHPLTLTLMNLSPMRGIMDNQTHHNNEVIDDPHE